MKKRLMKGLLVSACALLAACAVITVNVYFPEKAACRPVPRSAGATGKTPEQAL